MKPAIDIREFHESCCPNWHTEGGIKSSMSVVCPRSCREQIRPAWRHDQSMQGLWRQHNLKSPWPEAEEACAEELKRRRVTRCICKASSRRHISPGSSDSAGGRAHAQPAQCCGEGALGKFAGGAITSPAPSFSRPALTHASSAVYFHSCQHATEAEALVPYMVCSAVALIHNAFPNPPSLALHKLSRAGVQLLSSNFVWLKKKYMIARFTKCFFSLIAI